MSEPYYPLLIEFGVTRPFAVISTNAMIYGTTTNGVSEYIGTGPYMLTENKKNEYAVFEANPLYWGKQPNINKITMRIIPDNHARIFALEKGEIDLIVGSSMLDTDTLNSYKNKKGFTADYSLPTSTRHIAFNTAHPILSNINVRKAISHAIITLMLT